MANLETLSANTRRWLVISRAIVSLLLIGTMAVLIAAAVFAWQVVHTPFPGLFAEPTMIVNSLGDPTWSGMAAGLRIPEQILAIDGQPIDDTRDMAQILTHYEVGDVVLLRVRHAETDVVREVPVELTATPIGAWRDYFLVPYIMGWFYLLIGGWVLIARGREEAGQVCAILSISVALTFGLLLDNYTTHYFFLIWVVAIPLLGSSLAHLALVFPQPQRFLYRYPWIRLLIYLPGLAMALIGIKETLNWTDPIAYFGPWAWGRSVGNAGAIVFIVSMIAQRYLSRSPIVQRQTQVVLWVALFAFTPLIIWVFMALRVGQTIYPLLFFPPFALFPFSIAYVLLRYRLPDMDWVLRQGLVYAVLTVAVLCGYFLFLILFNWLFQATIGPDNPITLAVFILLIAILLQPLRLALQRLVNRILLGRKVTYEQALNEFSRLTMTAVKPQDVIHALAQAIHQALGAMRATLFVYDPKKGLFLPHVLGEAKAPIPAVRRDSELARWMEQGSSLFLYSDRPIPPALAADQELLDSLSAQLYVPLPRHGWLAISSPMGQRSFQMADLHFMEALAAQAATALERVDLVADLQQRVTEMEVLRYIAQAVGYSVEFDDLLELIYAQTSRVLDTSNFYIALHDRETDTLSFAFYTEGGERLYPDYSWPSSQGLTGVVIRTGMPLVTDDYLSECQKQGIQPGGKPGKAWMGVPLISQDRVLGVMNVSSFDPEVTYSAEEVQVFRIIADQAAGVLDKALLYRAMAERTRQLEALNEVGSATASTLELDVVLDIIIQKAMELIQAEAGSLLLVDQESEELVFHVASTPELIGMRLPKNTGIVGQVTSQAAPMIVNDVQQDGRWFSGVDEQSTFITRSVLAVPMIYRGNVIGVIELMNRRDRKSFTGEDQRLLLAFAADAAVAIENARLFTMTDQALAARVEELSMMQRIDRELNVSLDYNRVMDTTLNWALRVSGADIGLLAVTVETEEGERGLRFLAHRGYPEDVIQQFMDKLWPLNRGLIGRAVRTGRAELIQDTSQDADYVTSMPGMVAQLTVPISLEAQIIGVIALESSRRGVFNEESLQFVTRLADHAAISLENARLFEAVQAANNAKTEFVSFVSHELKQPMTSMKGYADLLVKGTAGELNDMQRQFMEVIRANISRMDSLVQDLLDISRIEAGRLKLEIRHVQMEELVEEAIRGVQRQIESKEQTLELAVQRPLPLVLADRNRVVQVLTNLLSNAFKYTPEGGNIHVQVEPVDGAFVRCTVTDTGIGMSEEELERLFTKYFRSSSAAVRNTPGTGLGLVITKSLVELQGGDIWVESELGKGSTFAFTIPTAPEPSNAQ